MSEVFQRAVDGLQADGVRFLLIGGVAVGQYVATRLTFDIDFAICERDAARMADVMRRASFTVLNETANFTRWNPPPGLQEVTDFLYVDERTFGLLWSGRNEREVGGRRVSVACPEHIIRMKLHALHYGKADRMKKDVPDILDLMPLCGWTPDHPDFRTACEKHAPGAVYGIIQDRWRTWRK